MRIVTPDAKNGIYLGRQGENLATQVQFDVNVAGWVETYGVGTWQLLNRRPSDPTGYPVEISVEDNIIKWDLTATDLKYAGCGTCELVYYVDEVIAKSIIYGTQILPAIDGTGEIPEPWESWYDDVMEARDEALEAAADAEEARVAIEDMTATAEIDDTTGTPTVVVTKTTVEDPDGTTHENLDFAFSGLKSAADMEAAVYDPDGSVAEAGGIADYVAGEISDLAPESEVQEIKDLIPNQASSENQLADKNFVNSSISTNTANYISNNGQPFTSVEQLEAYSGTVTNNDYAFVTGTDAAGNTYYDRYKATVSGGVVTWALEYRLNNSSFTAAQWAAIESGITSRQVSDYNAHLANQDNPHSVTKAQVGLGNVDNTPDAQKPVSQAQAAALALKADKVVDAVAGNLAGLDANGNLTDSGISPSDLELVKEVSNDPANSSFDIAIHDGQPAPVLSAVLKGKTAAINQLCPQVTQDVTRNGLRIVSSGASSHITGEALNAFFTDVLSDIGSVIKDHVYYVNTNTKVNSGASPSGSTYQFRYSDGGGVFTGPEHIFTASTNQSLSADFMVRIYSGQVGVALDFEITPIIIDLTRCGFTASETTDVATLKAAWLKKYGVPMPQYLPYNAGSILSNNATYQIHGRNLFDGTYSYDNAFLNSNGNISSGANEDITQYIRVTGGKSYYLGPLVGSSSSVCAYDEDKNWIQGWTYAGQSSKIITVPDNAYYIRATVYKANKALFCLNESDPSFNGQHEPYYNGGSIVADSLNGFEGAEIFDTQNAAGEIDRAILEYTFSNSDTWYSGYGGFYTSVPNTIKKVAGTVLPNMIVEGYATATYNGKTDGTACLLPNDRYLLIMDSGKTLSTIQAAMNGKKAVIELATPATDTTTAATLETKAGYNLLRPVSGDIQSGEVSMTYVKSSYLAKLIAWIRSIL